MKKKQKAYEEKIVSGVDGPIAIVKEEKKGFRISHLITTIVFLAFIFGFSIAGIISKDRKFSEMENRTLQQFPEFSFSSLKNGSFTSDIESYMSDQIFLKDELVSLKTDCDRLLKKNYQNGVYFGKDNYYLQDYKENKNQIDTNITSINNFAATIKNNASVTFLLAPNAISVMNDKLPKVTQTDDQLKSISYVESKLSKNISFYSPYNDLHKAYKNGTQVYYRTDHHWTSEGAKIAFEGLMKNMGESIPNVKYSIEKIDNFYGTLYSKAPSAFTKSDSVNLYTNPDNKITVTYTGSSGDNTDLANTDDIKQNSLFVDKFKTEKDKYKTFLGGNFDLLNIESQGEDDDNVLIIKDSYANSTMPFFADKYKHITVMDMRYYHMQAESVSEYVKSHKIKKVFFVYDMDFINSDNNFFWLD